MPRIVVITSNVRERLKRYIYNITINPSVEPKYKVETFRRAIEKANIILNDLYNTLSNEIVQYKYTQLNALGRRYGYRQYQYKDKSTSTVWLFGCDTTPSFNFVMIMQNSKLCLSHIEQHGISIIENKQYNTMKNTRNRVRLTESQLHDVIKESVKKVLNEANSLMDTETLKGIKYHKDEATFHIQQMLKLFNGLEDANDAYKNSQISMVRKALNNLSMAHCPDVKWREDGPSLSTQADMDNGTLKYRVKDDFDE